MHNGHVVHDGAPTFFARKMKAAFIFHKMSAYQHEVL